MRPQPRHLLRFGVIAVAAYYALWGGEYGAFDLRRLHAMTQQKTADLIAARLAVDSLRTTVRQLESDSATVERIARERFGMVRPGEFLYRFAEVPPAPSRTDQ